MDPVSTVAIVGVGYILVNRETAKPAADTQPENTGPIIQSKKDRLPPKVFGGGLGGALGALGGKAISDLYGSLTASYDAPITKEIANTTFIAVSAVGGAIIVIVGLSYGALAAGYVGVIVIAVLAICFAAFVIAANVEDVDRWNRFVAHKQLIVKSVSAGAFVAALGIMDEGAKKGIPGLGFYLQPNVSTVYYRDTLYYKTAFDATPKIPAPGGHGGILNRGGLDNDYYLPVIVPYDYNTYFGKDGAHVLTRNDGTKLNMISFLTDLYNAQKSAYDGLKAQLGKVPTWEQWIANADKITDKQGKTLREWIALHDAFGAYIQPAVPWLDTYLLQSPEFAFDFNGSISVYNNHKRDIRAGLANSSFGLTSGYGGFNPPTI